MRQDIFRIPFIRFELFACGQFAGSVFQRIFVQSRKFLRQFVGDAQDDGFTFRDVRRFVEIKRPLHRVAGQQAMQRRHLERIEAGRLDAAPFVERAGRFADGGEFIFFGSDDVGHDVHFFMPLKSIPLNKASWLRILSEPARANSTLATAGAAAQRWVQSAAESEDIG